MDVKTSSSCILLNVVSKPLSNKINRAFAHPALLRRQRSLDPGRPTSECAERWRWTSRWLFWCPPGWQRWPQGLVRLRSRRRAWPCCPAACTTPQLLASARPVDRPCLGSLGTGGWGKKSVTKTARFWKSQLCSFSKRPPGVSAPFLTIC